MELFAWQLIVIVCVAGAVGMIIGQPRLITNELTEGQRNEILLEEEINCANLLDEEERTYAKTLDNIEGRLEVCQKSRDNAFDVRNIVKKKYASIEALLDDFNANVSNRYNAMELDLNEFYYDLNEMFADYNRC